VLPFAHLCRPESLNCAGKKLLSGADLGEVGMDIKSEGSGNIKMEPGSKFPPGESPSFDLE
jgi:hypothetical protein